MHFNLALWFPVLGCVVAVACTSSTGYAPVDGGGGAESGGSNMGGLGGADSSTGDANCCAAHGTPGCSDATVQNCVCSVDNTCCVIEWNAACVEQAVLHNCAACPDSGSPSGGGTGGSGGTGGTPGGSCSDPLAVGFHCGFSSYCDSCPGSLCSCAADCEAIGDCCADYQSACKQVQMPSGCLDPTIFTLCNPVTNEGCAGNGVKCDYNGGAFVCWGPPHDVPPGGSCASSGGPHCQPKNGCDQPANSATGVCKPYCCSDADCNGGTCTRIGTKYTFGYCNSGGGTGGTGGSGGSGGVAGSGGATDAGTD